MDLERTESLSHLRMFVAEHQETALVPPFQGKREWSGGGGSALARASSVKSVRQSILVVALPLPGTGRGKGKLELYTSCGAGLVRAFFDFFR